MIHVRSSSVFAYTCNKLSYNNFSLFIIHIFLKTNQMQLAAQVLKQDIWKKLKTYFEPYKNKSGQLSIDNLDQFIIDVLHEQTQAQRDYVLKNHFRLDVDSSGSVSFNELGNFLFKRHCGQMSLQRKHRGGKIQNGAKRLLTCSQFIDLINEAYAFLDVKFEQSVGEFIFNSVDADHDHLITYVEYFKAIEQFLCQNPPNPPKPPNPPIPPKPEPSQQKPERPSKLRRHIWEQLKILYDGYVQGRSLCSDIELKGLLYAIIKDLSDNDFIFLSNELQKLDFKHIGFDEFASEFIYLVGQIGLSRFSINRQSSRRVLNRDEFVRLLKNSYDFLNLANFKNSILFKIFAKIDKNCDGYITYEEYLDWVKRFLSVLHYRDDEFYVPQDDQTQDPSDPYDKPQPIPNNNRFVFDDYTFAKAVRARVWQLLIPYDTDKNEQFEQKEIQCALRGLFKEDELQLKYVTKNVFRYDRDNDNSVTYHELTNFCVEQHFGELVIQRLHKQKFYCQWAKRIMSRKQFGQTINLVLKFINMSATEQLLDSVFKVIDVDKDGWISYEVYFLFLKYYFGGASIAALETLKKQKKQKVEKAGLSQDQNFTKKLEGLNPFQRFSRIIIDQLRSIFFKYDYNKNKVFQYDEIKDILLKVFELDSNELSYILMRYFTFDAEKNGSLTFDELISLILTIFFTEIVFKRKFTGSSSKDWVSKKLNLEQFTNLFIEYCFFIRIKPSREDLAYIFKQLDTDEDGYITFTQYSNFINKYLGNGIDLSGSRYSGQFTGISEEELKFVHAIWDELKKYFDKYDIGKKTFLKVAELRAFIIEVLQETTQKQLNYVFWNLFRVDNNYDKEIDFGQFAPFILNHAGEISLQRFHREQIAGKNSLASQQFYQVLCNGYSFLSSIPKEKKIVSAIFDRVKGNCETVSYAGYLNWIHRALAAKYKK